MKQSVTQFLSQEDKPFPLGAFAFYTGIFFVCSFIGYATFGTGTAGVLFGMALFAFVLSLRPKK